jgi:hypothetical protein
MLCNRVEMGLRYVADTIWPNAAVIRHTTD